MGPRILMCVHSFLCDCRFCFVVLKQVYDRFVARVTELAGKLRQGPVLGKETVDCGAMVMPAQLDIVQVFRCLRLSCGSGVLARELQMRS